MATDLRWQVSQCDVDLALIMAREFVQVSDQLLFGVINVNGSVGNGNQNVLIWFDFFTISLKVDKTQIIAKVFLSLAFFGRVGSKRARIV